MRQGKEKKEAAFKKGDLVRAYAYYLDPGEEFSYGDQPFVVLNVWWVSHEWSWVYDLYDPVMKSIQHSVIEGLVRPLRGF